MKAHLLLPLALLLVSCDRIPGAIDKADDAGAICDPYSGPEAASLQAYEGLMHEHGAYSDGDPHYIPADYFKIAADNGYQFVGSSEHSDSLDIGNYFTLHASCTPSDDNFDPAQLEYCFLNPSMDKLFKWNSTLDQAQAASNENFLAIRGFEWTSDVFGHINVYFSKNFSNAKTDGGYALTMETFWSWFTRDPDTPGLGGSPTSTVPLGGGNDALAHFNHPGDKCIAEDVPGPIGGWCNWNNFTLVPDAVERMFGIEAYNDGNREDRYLPDIVQALDIGWRLSFIGSEDEHFAEYAVEHRPKTVTLAQSLSEDGFKEAWLARRTYALSPGIHARVQFDAAGHPMGSQLSCNAGGSVPVRVAVTNKDGSPFSGSLQVFSNGGELVSQLASASGELQLPVLEGRHWYFVRVHGADGQSAIYVAPVWITSR